MWWRVLFILAIAGVPALGAPKSKPCQSMHSAATCVDHGGCAWVNVSQGKGKGNTNKCRPLAPTPRT